ncbi:hypothetical protein ES695_03235 [Candidatus Atribacteria bacterium 1244-E10-H5-B2]|nr:MAG: hypothetical protein ES695_03235 [Candidatus Atribacteria bacterium 1244-E10-H5-B2]
MDDLRAELAREWAKKHNIQLSLFDREYQIKLKATNKQRRLNKESSEKSKDICQGIRAKEFKQMCKKAGVETGSLAKTVFTRNIESS